MKDEEREIDNCLIMRIKKLKEQVKNLIQQVIGSCILAFTKNKEEKRIADLERENKLLGERCNQLLKDKGDLTDTNSRLLSQVAATTKKVIELEQKIKWHDLTKDPKDLPGKDDYQILITYIEYNHKWVTLGHYDHNTKKWFTSMELPLKKVIAWKTIIKLDKDVI